MPLAQMPADLQRHIRYPEDFFAIQARKYADLPHARSPGVLQQGGSCGRCRGGRSRAATARWSPTTRSCGCPARPRRSSSCSRCSIPSRRDNMIGWLAARSDLPNYGRLIAYNFPKQKLVYGPRQIDARIDQDPVISQQLSLWNQRGSTVIRGSLLAIPLDQSLIYVQPLYLAASEQGALPELRRVIVAHGNQIAMEPTLEQSLSRIFVGRAGPTTAVASPAAPGAGAPAPLRPVSACWPSGRSRPTSGRKRRCGAATGPPYGAEQKRLEETLRELTSSRQAVAPGAARGAGGGVRRPRGRTPQTARGPYPTERMAWVGVKRVGGPHRQPPPRPRVTATGPVNLARSSSGRRSAARTLVSILASASIGFAAPRRLTAPLVRRLTGTGPRACRARGRVGQRAPAEERRRTLWGVLGGHIGAPMSIRFLRAGTGRCRGRGR